MQEVALRWRHSGGVSRQPSDNQSAIKVAQNSLLTRKSKHSVLKWLAVRDFAENIAYVPTQLNKSDPLTKPMQNPLLVFIINLLLNSFG